MKKILLLMLLMAMSTTALLAQITINNNGFEGTVNLSDQKYPYGNWETATAGGSSATFELEDTDAAELTNAARVVVTDWNGTRPGDRWNVQLKHSGEFNFIDNTQYVLKFKAKASVIDAKLEGIMTLGTKSNGVIHRVYQYKYLSTEWKEYQVYFKVDPAVVVTVEGKLALSLQSDATFWFDDFSITEVDETYMTDGSFENTSWSLDATDDVGQGTVDYFSHATANDVQDGEIALKANITTAPDRVYDLKATIGLPEAVKTNDIRVSFWGRSDEASGTQQKIYLPWHYSSTTNAPTFELSTEWEKYSVVLNYTDNGKGKSNELIFYFWQAATYYVDNVVVETVAAGVNNFAPVVDAGANITCQPGDVITLDATVNEPDGDIYTLWWSLPLSAEELKVSNEARKTKSIEVTIPATITEETDLVFSLAANDNLLEGKGEITVKVKPVSTAIDTNKKDLNDLIYPNPANDKIQLHADVIAIEFYSVNGMCVKRASGMEQSLDISNLSSGIYILKLNLKDGSTVTTKLIKR